MGTRLGKNPLDLTKGSETMQIINYLEDAGVTVFYDGFESGDVNGDGKIDVSDAIMVLRNIVGLVELTPAQELATDVNGDGKIDVSDAIMILRYIVGLITEFPNQ